MVHRVPIATGHSGTARQDEWTLNFSVHAAYVTTAKRTPVSVHRALLWSNFPAPGTCTKDTPASKPSDATARHCMQSCITADEEHKGRRGCTTTPDEEIASGHEPITETALPTAKCSGAGVTDYDAQSDAHEEDSTTEKEQYAGTSHDRRRGHPRTSNIELANGITLAAKPSDKCHPTIADFISAGDSRPDDEGEKVAQKAPPLQGKQIIAEKAPGGTRPRQSHDRTATGCRPQKRPGCSLPARTARRRTRSLSTGCETEWCTLAGRRTSRRRAEEGGTIRVVRCGIEPSTAKFSGAPPGSKDSMDSAKGNDTCSGIIGGSTPDGGSHGKGHSDGKRQHDATGTANRERPKRSRYSLAVCEGETPASGTSGGNARTDLPAPAPCGSGAPTMHADAHHEDVRQSMLAASAHSLSRKCMTQKRCKPAHLTVRKAKTQSGATGYEAPAPEAHRSHTPYRSSADVTGPAPKRPAGPMHLPDGHSRATKRSCVNLLSVSRKPPPAHKGPPDARLCGRGWHTRWPPPVRATAHPVQTSLRDIFARCQVAPADTLSWCAGSEAPMAPRS